MVLLGGLAVAASGQSVVMAQYKGALYPVVKAKAFRAFVAVNGETVAADGTGLDLRPAAEFLPVIVSLRDLKTLSTYTSTSVGPMASKRNELAFSAQLVSPYLLKDVFLVIEIDTPGGNGLFLGEVGTLRPYEAVPVKETVPIPALLGDVKYQVHVFSAGTEVFNSELPFDYREAKLDQMVYSRIQNALVDSPAKPFVGPGPEYPASMRASGIRGEAVLTVHVTPRGAVADPIVKTATNPAFGEAALAAVRQWRYLPKISLGQPVETTIEVRFDFAPPSHGGS